MHYSSWIKNMRDRIIRVLTELAKNNEEVVLLTCDIGFKVLDDFREKYPLQFYNTGITEQATTGIATGMALEGKIVFTYSIANFNSLKCLEQIRNDAAYHNANVKIMSIGAGFSYGSLGMSHHLTEDISIMKSIPNLVVFSPADSEEAEAVIRAAYEYNGTCYLRLGRGGEKVFNNKIEQYRIGDAIELFDGIDGYIFSTGPILEEAIKAKNLLSKMGYTIGVVSFPTIKPVNKDIIIDITKKCKHIFTVEENNIIGGFGSSIAEVLCDNNIHIRLSRIGIKDSYFSFAGDQLYMRRICNIDHRSILNIILSELNNI